jgi:hypothetical protein
MDELMILALTQKSSQSRARLIEALRRKRDRAMMKWKSLAITIVGFYFWWKGGGVTVVDKAGKELDITDPALPMDVRLQAMALQGKQNSNDNRLYFLLISLIDWIFLMVYDSRDMEIYQGELFRALDYSDAPSPEQLAEWNARYQAQWSQPQAAAPIAAAAASGPLGSQGNPIGAPARRVDRF